jgi:hypothetical protein
MDNVFLYADNDRVTDIFTTYNVSMKEALEHEKTAGDTEYGSSLFGREIF